MFRHTLHEFSDTTYYFLSVTGSGGKRINILGNGKNIDGTSSVNIESAYQNATMVYNGTEWSRI